MERIFKCGSYRTPGAGAGQETKTIAMESARKPAQDKPRKGLEANVAVASIEAAGRPPKKCRFCRGTWLHYSPSLEVQGFRRHTSRRERKGH